MAGPSVRAAASANPGRIAPIVLERASCLATNGYPYEVCGLLLAQDPATEGRIDRLVELPNRHSGDRRVRFRIDPSDYQAGEQWAEDRGLRVAGVFHSHPDRAANPSAEDRAGAWPGFHYLIVPVGRAELGPSRVYRADAGGRLTASAMERPSLPRRDG